jgi:hypothetical protein
MSGLCTAAMAASLAVLYVLSVVILWVTDVMVGAVVLGCTS